MKQLSELLLEKLRINGRFDNSSTISSNENKIREEFENEESIKTLKLVLDFIRKSKRGDFKDSIFNYWRMSIKDNKLNCEHIGWSSDGIGWRNIKYVEKVIDNYNKDHNTNIKGEFAGGIGNAGICILNIKEVVDELKKKFNNVNIDDKDLVDIGL